MRNAWRESLSSAAIRAKRLLAEFNATDYADTARRLSLLREMLGSIGEGVHVDIDFHCEYGQNIFLGNRVIINMNCTFVDNNRIDIGDGVMIASNVQIYTATHSIPAGCVAVGNPCRVIRQLDGINYKTGRGEMQC